MKQQSYSNNIKRFAKKEQCYIQDHGIIGMQGMKIDTASIRLKNWVCKQMV